MTEKLKTLMREQADSVDFAAPDLGAMVATGDRRVRRRRFGAVAGTAAAAAGVAVAAPFLGLQGRAVEPTSPTTSAAPISWVVGTTLHEGERTFALDFRPRAYVRTAEGYVFSDGDGTVWSWVDGAASKVGRTDSREPRLVADQETGLAGWLDLSDGVAYAVLDQAEGGGVSSYHFPRLDESAQFLALDDQTAYWETADGPAAYDVGSGTSDGGLRPGGVVVDVEDSYVAVRTDAGIAIRTAANRDVRRLDGFHGEVGTFSDDARFFSNDADEPQVFDVVTGERVQLDVGGRRFATGYEWLGGDSLAVLAADHDEAVAELLVCDVSAGTCREGARLATFADLAGRLVLPVGQAMG